MYYHWLGSEGEHYAEIEDDGFVTVYGCNG
jgi:hypothetical protein